MDLLKKNKCLFGVSVCYTRKNLPTVTSDRFIDFIIGKGAKYMLNFNYMPVGHGADVDLIPTPEQRKELYFWNKKMRNGKTGKPIFIMDFQNDGEYVGGCIAGGRNYFHINSAGDMEPCVFIHFSDSNIRTHTLLEALQRPLFMAFRHDQPFNENHLRPCPMLENSGKLAEMVRAAKAHSTDLQSPQTAEALCANTKEYAENWAPAADKMWEELTQGKQKR